MSQESIEQFLGRAITDERFRERAKKSLISSCNKEGFMLSEAEAILLAKFDLKLFDGLAESLDNSIRRN